MTTTFDCPASRAVFESSGSSLGKIAAGVSAVEAQTIAAIAMSRTTPAGAGGRKNNLGKNWRMGFEKSRSAGFLVKASIEPEPRLTALAPGRRNKTRRRGTIDGWPIPGKSPRGDQISWHRLDETAMALGVISAALA